MDAAPGDGVEARGRLVENQQLRVVQCRESQSETLLLPSRQAQHARLPLVDEIDRVQDLRCIHGSRIEGAEQPKRLLHREGFGKFSVLKLDSEFLSQLHRVYLWIEAEDPDGSRCGRSQALEYFDERGLPRSVRSEKADDAATRHFEGEPPEGMNPLVVLLQVSNLNHHDGRIADGAAVIECLTW